MSAPDARLSAAERAAFADLEAAATAADPNLAVRLQGAPVTRIRARMVALQPAVLRVWRIVLGLRWWGIPLALGGLVLTVAGLGTNLVISVAGALVTLVGLRVLAEMIEQRAGRRPRSPGSR